MADDSFGVMVEFKAKYDSVTQGFNQISKGTDKVVESNKKAERSFDALGARAKQSADTILNQWLGLGVALSAAGLIHFFNKTAESIDNLTDTARGLGISADAFQKLSYGASLGGVGMDELGDSLKKFNIAVGQAMLGNEDMIASFKALGVNIDDLKGKDVAQQFALTAEAASKLEDKNIAAANAAQVFGRNYVSALNLGRDGIAQNIAEFDKLGVKLTDTQRKAVDAFGDAKTKLGVIFDGFFQKVVADSAPAFAKLVDGVSNFIEKSGGIDGLAAKVGDKIVDIVEKTIAVFNALRPGFEALLNTLGTMVSTATTLFNESKNFLDTYSDNMSQGNTNAHVANPGIADFAYDFTGGSSTSDSWFGRMAARLENLVFPYDVAPKAFNEYDPNNINATSAGSRTNPYLAQGGDAAGIAASALSSMGSIVDKTNNELDKFKDNIQKSNDKITSSLQAFDDQRLTDALNRIMSIVNGTNGQSQADYDKETKVTVDTMKALGVKGGGYLNQAQLDFSTSQYDLNRQLNRPSDALPTTSKEFDQSAAELIQGLKDGSLTGNNYGDALRSLGRQQDFDMVRGLDSAEQKVIDEIQKYATSLGVKDKEQLVTISVAPTNDFTIKVLTNADAKPYLDAAVANSLDQAANQGANT